MSASKSRPQMLKDEHFNTKHGQTTLEDMLWGQEDAAKMAKDRAAILKNNTESRPSKKKLTFEATAISETGRKINIHGVWAYSEFEAKEKVMSFTKDRYGFVPYKIELKERRK